MRISEDRRTFYLFRSNFSIKIKVKLFEERSTIFIKIWVKLLIKSTFYSMWEILSISRLLFEGRWWAFLDSSGTFLDIGVTFMISLSLFQDRPPIF